MSKALASEVSGAVPLQEPPASIASIRLAVSIPQYLCPAELTSCNSEASDPESTTSSRSTPALITCAHDQDGHGRVWPRDVLRAQHESWRVTAVCEMNVDTRGATMVRPTQLPWSGFTHQHSPTRPLHAMSTGPSACHPADPIHKQIQIHIQCNIYIYINRYRYRYI